MAVQWRKSEEKMLRGLGTPARVQTFLDSLTYRCEDGHLSASAALRERRAHCFDGALLAAAVLRRAAFEPKLIDLCATRDDDHIVCAYRWKGRWGAVAKSNFPGLRFREPIFKSARELVLSYFEFYFNLEREKSLRSFSAPMRLPSVARVDWECDDSQGDRIVEMLTRQRHHSILLPGQGGRLRSLDERLYRSQLIGVDRKGAYGGS